MAFGTKRFAGFYFGEGDGVLATVARAVGGTPDRRAWSERDALDRRLEVLVRRSMGDREDARRRTLAEDDELARLVALGMI